MAEKLHQYDGLSTREGFNRSLKHFKFIMQVISEFERFRNLADIMSDRLAEKSIEPEQVLPTINAILLDRYHYTCRSHNLQESLEEFSGVASEVGKWKAMDLVVVYFHPDLGIVAVNPKNLAHWEGVRSLKKNELLTVYAGAFQNTDGKELYDAGIESVLTLLEGGKVKTPPAFTKGRFVQKASPKPAPARATKRAARGRPPRAAAPRRSTAADPAAAAPAVQPAAPAPQPSSAAKRMTPMYAIPVTNELFHNGNVEAWKKIIQSYTTKYPGLEVFVFYEGERIHDINTLFKWGKVKHGSAIMISVAGEDIKDVAKLQRYLKQGASHMFEAFLKAPVNTVLNLF